MSLWRIFTPSLIYATLRSATPLIYAALCAAITQQANILNIGTEGIMLTGAFTAVAVSFLTGSWLLGVICAMVAGIILGMIMAVGHIKYGADNCAIGMGINLFAVAITKFMLNSVLGKSGTFTDPDLAGIPKVSLGFLEGNDFINTVFNNWNITEWLAIVLHAGIGLVQLPEDVAFRADGAVNDEGAGKAIQKADLDVSGLGGDIAGDHGCFAGGKGHDADGFGAGDADLLGQIGRGMGYEVRQRHLFARNEFLNDPLFIRHRPFPPAFMNGIRGLF